MSLTMHVDAIQPATKEWKKMKAVWDACLEADISAPDEVKAFFDGEEPKEDPKGSVIDLSFHDSVEDWTGEDSETGYDGTGYEVDIAKLPPGTTHLRFYFT